MNRLIKFTDDTRLGKMVRVLEDRVRSQNGLDRLKKRSDKEKINFRKDKVLS